MNNEEEQKDDWKPINNQVIEYVFPKSGRDKVKKVTITSVVNHEEIQPIKVTGFIGVESRDYGYSCEKFQYYRNQLSLNLNNYMFSDREKDAIINDIRKMCQYTYINAGNLSFFFSIQELIIKYAMYFIAGVVFALGWTFILRGKI